MPETNAQVFVREFRAGTPLASARRKAGLIDICRDSSPDFQVYIFQDGSRAGYKPGNNKAKPQAWEIGRSGEAA